MKELDDLNGLNNAMKGISLSQEKINEIFNGQEMLKKIANPFSGNEHLLGISSQLKAINGLTDKFKSPFEDILKPKNGIYIGDNALSQHLNNGLKVTNSINMGGTLNQIVNKDLMVSNSALLQSVNKASLFYNMDGLKPLNSIIQGIDTLKPYTASFNGLNEMKPLIGISQIINDKIGIYNQQMKLSEQMGQALSGHFSIKESTLNHFNSTNFLNIEKLNSFDVLSASTFLKEYGNFNNDVELSQSMSEVKTLLSENSNLKDEIIKMQNTMIVLQQSSKMEIHIDTWSSFGGYSSIFEWFYQKKLIKDFGLTPIKAKIVMVSLFILGLVLGRAEDVTIEAKGTDLFNGFVSYFNSDEHEKGIAHELSKHITLPEEISDFTIKNTPVYLRSSYKSKYVGVFPKLTNVKVLKMKNEWSFVEGIANVYKENKSRNKKLSNSNDNPIVLKEKIKGWVKNDNLDMFQ